MKRRFLSLLLIMTVLIAFVAAGCGTPGQTTKTPEVTTTKALGGNLVVSVPAGDPFESAWRHLLEQFGEDNGVSAELDAVPWGNMREKQALELSGGGGGYDVVYVHPFWFGELTDNNYLVPVTDFCSEEEIKEFVPNLLELYTRDGVAYGLPDWITTHILAYREDLFKAAGFSEPKSWDDILKAAEHFADGDNMYGISFPGKKGGALAGIFSTTLLSNDGWLKDKDGNPAMNSVAAVETVEFLAKLSKYAPPGYQNNHWEESAAVAGSGKAPMVMLMTANASWLNDPERSQTVGKWAFAAITNKTGGGMIDSYCWSVAKSSKNRAAAEALVKFLAGTEAQIYLSENTGTFGATNKFYESKELIESRPELSAMNKAFAHSEPNPSWNTWAAEQEVLETNLQKVFNGTMSAADALKEVQSKMSEKP